MNFSSLENISSELLIVKSVNPGMSHKDCDFLTGRMDEHLVCVCTSVNLFVLNAGSPEGHVGSQQQADWL